MKTPANTQSRQAADPVIALNSPVLTAASLYLLTNSIIVTLIGATASAVLTGWEMWLSHRPQAGQPSNLPS
jgi:hypothetical protein